jgi:hypothetical protein
VRRIAAACVVVCAACGSAPGTVVNGTVAGQSINVVDAISNVIQSGAQSETGILITNVGNTCSSITAQQQLKNARSLDMVLGTMSATGITAAGVGAYTVYPSGSVPTAGNVAVVTFTSTDLGCIPRVIFEAQSGTVTVSSADSRGYTATFDVVFPSGADHLTGTFNTVTCPSLGKKIPSTCPP